MKLGYSHTISELNKQLRAMEDEVRQISYDRDLSEKRLNDLKNVAAKTKNNKILHERSSLVQSEEKCRQLELLVNGKTEECSELQADIDQLQQVVDQQMEQIRGLAKVWYVHCF